MDRDIDNDDRRDPGPEREDHRNQPIDPTRAGGDSSPESARGKPSEQARPPLNRERPNEPTHDLGQTKDVDRERQISETALETAREIGRFRTLAVDDLRRLQYGGDATAAARDLNSLRAQGFIERRTIWAGHGQGKIELVALTPQGKRLLECEDPGTSQVFYERFVKPAEILHDAAIYRMFKAEADRIEQARGKVRRVVLDYELKQKAYSPLAKAKALPSADYARRQQEIARENSLKVVQGHIALPDLRIEYETSGGQQAHVNLELATEHYRGSHLASKAEAGFKMYAAGEHADHLSSVLEERGITEEIFSL